jgi:hypothetical protein
MSKTDVVNRAISLYAFVDAALDLGGELVMRRPGEPERVIGMF